MLLIQEKEIRVKFNPGLNANRPSNNCAQVFFFSYHRQSPLFQLPEHPIETQRFGHFYVCPRVCTCVVLISITATLSMQVYPALNKYLAFTKLLFLHVHTKTVRRRSKVFLLLF